MEHFLQIAYTRNSSCAIRFAAVTEAGEPLEEITDDQYLRAAICRLGEKTSDQGHGQEQNLNGKKQQRGQATHGNGRHAGVGTKWADGRIHKIRITRPPGRPPTRALVIMRSWSLGRVVLFELLMTLRRFAILAVQLIPFLLLTLAGWGWDDWRGFFSHPARAGLIAAIVLGADWSCGFDSICIRCGEGVRWWEVKLWFCWFWRWRRFSWSGSCLLPIGGRCYTLHPFLRYLGLVMCCLGIAVRLLALAKLGRHFSAYVTLQDDHQLVQSGIYGIVRHPLYLSLLLAAPGFALVFASILVWPILLMALAFVTLRIREEDNLLESRFGVEFREYRGRTGALLPRVG